MFAGNGQKLSVLAAGLLLWAALPGTLSAQNFDPWRQATIYRDAWGVPHIYGETQESLAFAFGYAQAEDHLRDMLLAYRVANGRAAEVLGEAYAESDAFSIKVGHADLAEEAWYGIDAMTAALCTGFARGVNAWIVEHPDRVPTWAEGVKPQDILALWHAYLMSHAPVDMPDVWRRAPAAHTGNAWAVAPQRSASGGAMLVVNPHQRHNGFFRWYEAHLVMPGYNMYGATLFGLPVILQGHNGLLGWALTPNFADTADVYQEPITEEAKGNPAEIGRQIASIPQRTGVMLEYAARSRPYYVRTAGGLEERAVPQWIVERGPVLQGGSDYFYTWRVGGYRSFGGLAQLFLMGGATSLEAFQSALYLQQLPCFHITYADRAGNLFYLYNAVSGIRDANSPLPDGVEPFHWKSPAPPHNDHLFWGEVFTPAELPHLLNPDSGYIQASGNPPWTVTDDPPYTPDMWPYWLSEDVDTYRARRVRELLRSGTLSFQDMQNMIFDDALPAARDMAGLLLHAAEENPDFVRTAHPDLGAVLERLRSWDYSASTDSTAMTYYHLWWAMLQSQNPFGVDSDTALQQALFQNTPETRQFILEAAAEAVRLMRNQYGTVEIPWGDVHRMVRGNKEKPIPGAGTGGAIFVSSDYVYEGDRWQVTYGYGFAMAVEFGELPRAVSIVPFGASESPTSPHYADQLELFANKRFKPTHFLMEDVARHAVRAYGGSVTLYPKGVDGAVYTLSNVPVEASVKTLPEPPVPLPDGAAAFALFVRPELNPTPNEMMFQYDVRISEALCAPENLGTLALYAYNEGRGWIPFEEQSLDPEMRVLSGRHPYPALYAVLGPEDALLSAFDPGKWADAEAWEGESAPPFTAEGEHDFTLPEEFAPRRQFAFVRHDLPEGVSTEDTLSGRPGVSMGPTRQRTFSFERHDLPQGMRMEDTLSGRTATIAAPTGQRQFMFERHDAPSAAPEPQSTPPEPERMQVEPPSALPDAGSVPAPAAPKAQETPEAPETTTPQEDIAPQPPAPAPPSGQEGPAGRRQFHFERN